MSDYLTELRRDLVDAHGRHRRSRTLPRAARALRRRPQVALAALAAAACAAGLLTGAAALRDRAPAEALRVVAVVPLGGQPIDATLVAGSLWVARYDGDVLRVDPVRREVARRIRLGRNVSSIAGTARDVWVTTEPAVDESGGRLVRLDPATGDISARVRLGAFAAVLAAGDRSLWALDSQNDAEAPERIRRIDPADGTTLASVATGSAGADVAVAPGAVWTLGRDGTVARLDARLRRTVWRLPRVGAVPLSSDDQLAVDARGAWMVSPEHNAILRIEAGRVVRRIAVDPRTLPTLAGARGALWTVSQQTRQGYRLARIDTDTGRTTATVALGPHRPQALVRSPGGLWVVAGDGNALLVRAGSP